MSKIIASNIFLNLCILIILNNILKKRYLYWNTMQMWNIVDQIVQLLLSALCPIALFVLPELCCKVNAFSRRLGSLVWTSNCQTSGFVQNRAQQRAGCPDQHLSCKSPATERQEDQCRFPHPQLFRKSPATVRRADSTGWIPLPARRTAAGQATASSWWCSWPWRLGMPGSLQTTFPERAVGTAQLCRILTKKLKVLVLDLLLTATVLVHAWIFVHEF